MRLVAPTLLQRLSSGDAPARKRWTRLGRTAFAAIAVLVGASVPGWNAETPAIRAAAKLRPADEALLDELQRTAFQFFAEQTHPRTGLVRDRARADGTPSAGKASIAASGFAFDAWVVAAERGWTTRDEAITRVRAMLRFLVEQAPRRHGFFYHFMEMDTGERAWRCEVSSIDTALCLAGAIVAREYFQDPEITTLVDRLHGEIDWQWFLNGGATPSLGWHDEHGFSRYRWQHFAEHLLMHLLGLGAPTRPFPAETWRAWARDPVGTYAGYTYLQHAPLFIHQFSQAYFDLREKRDAFADYHHNSVLATLAQRQFCIDLQPEFPRWGADLWGVTASDSATGYKAWGGPPRSTGFNALDGSIVPCAPAGSLPFAPAETLHTLHHMRTTYGEHAWQRYGFVDAFNPHNGWVNSDVLGIDLGISLVQAENLRTGLIWNRFMRAPEAQRGLQRAGLLSTRRTIDNPTTEAAIRTLAERSWERVREAGTTSENIGLLLTAAVAAHALGFEVASTAQTRARHILDSSNEHPAGHVAIAQYGAGLITIRQTWPDLASTATQRLKAIRWPEPRAETLGSASRLAAFLHIASNPRDASAWSSLIRSTEPVGNVFVLAPARVTDQLLPGLWLDEKAIVTGASAAQLAYAQIVAGETPDLATLALWLDCFPAEAAARLPPNDIVAAASVADQAVWLISVANLLAESGPRTVFQRDPLVIAARAAIPEFGEAAFGPNTSLVWQRELAGPPNIPPERATVALASNAPSESWTWTTLTAPEFKDSVADLRPDDPPVQVRFAFTWDARALYLHANADDAPPGFSVPHQRRRWVELFIDPAGDGLVWDGAGDFQFLFSSDGSARETFHGATATVHIRPTRAGYTVEAEIPWTQLGIEPRAGLELRVAPAIVAEGTREWEPSVKLTWRYHRRVDGRADLGVLRLQ